MFCGSVHQIAAIVQFPRLDGLERARLKELRIDNIRLRTRRMRVSTPPLQRAPTTAEHSRFRARFEIAVTVPTPCDRFDPVDGTELPQLRVMLAAQAFGGPKLEAAIGRALRGTTHDLPPVTCIPRKNFSGRIQRQH